MENKTGISKVPVKNYELGTCEFQYPQKQIHLCSKKLCCCVVAAQPEGGSMQPWKTLPDTNGSGSNLMVFVIPRFEAGSGCSDHALSPLSLLQVKHTAWLFCHYTSQLSKQKELRTLLAHVKMRIVWDLGLICSYWKYSRSINSGLWYTI